MNSRNMMNLVLLLVAAALVSHKCGTQANPMNAIVDNSLNSLDTSLEPVVVPPKRSRRYRNYVHIFSAPKEVVTRGVTDRVVLQCVAIGNPPPAITWARNGEPIQDFEEELNEILPANTNWLARLVSKLVITTSNPGEDQYTCIATSGTKRDTATSTVHTEQGDDDELDLLALQKIFLPTGPTITYYFENILTLMGRVVVLPCRVHSFTKTQLFWHDNKERFISNNNPRMKVMPSGDLIINDLLWSDMGNFTCYANNVYGKDSISTFIYPMTT